MITLTILLQAKGVESIINYIPMILIFGVVYFFFIRPQAKKQKEQESFSNSLSVGMDIVTTSGILGKITKMNEGVTTIQVDQKTFIKILNSAISKEMTDSLNK